MSRRLEQVQRSHDIRLKSSDGVCPRDSWQALGTEVENMRRLIFSKESLYSLSVTQITLHKTKVCRFRK